MTMLTRFDPTTEVTSLRNGVNSLLGELLNPMPSFGHGATRWAPRLDAYETADAVTVHVELPGVDPKEVDVSVTDGVLTIAGAYTPERDAEGVTWKHFERASGRFTRSVNLPARVDVDAIDATYRRGLLTIRLPKAAEALPKRIEIKVKR